MGKQPRRGVAPAEVVEELGVKEGDEVSMTLKVERAEAPQQRPTAEELLARVREMRRPLPAGFKFDRDEANER